MGGGEKKIIFVYDRGVWGKKYRLYYCIKGLIQLVYAN